MDDTMRRGAVIVARKIFDSQIFIDKPDKWFKIWVYLIGKVNHKDTPRFKKGNGFVRYSEIREACGATKGQVDHAIRWFKREGVLATRKATRGMHITIVKYDLYQNLDNYKRDAESDLKATKKRQRSDTKDKNGNNENNEKNKDICQVFQDYWNSKETLPKIRAFNGKRVDKLKARLKEAVFVESWREAIDKISVSPFCLGQTGGTWKADVSWFLANSDNYVKALEGKYDGEKVETEAQRQAREKDEYEEYQRSMANA